MSYQYQAGIIKALDGFTGRTAGAALGGTAGEVGGTWATAGATTDFAAADAPGTSETMARSAASQVSLRTAILGSTSYARTEVGVGYRLTSATAGRQCVIARWADANNHLLIEVTNSGDADVFRVHAVVAGSSTSLGTRFLSPAVDTWRTLRVVVFESGLGRAWVLNENGGALATLVFQSSALATGGALASGKPGFADAGEYIAAGTRYYRNFYAATPPAEQFAIYADRSIEIRHDACERESADGTTWGKPKSYTGGRVYVPASGDEGRVTRLWVKVRRNDIDEAADDHIADSVTVKVTLRPRYLLPTSP